MPGQSGSEPSAGKGPGRAVAALHERAAAQIRGLVTGEDWAGWLRIAARFPGWSFTNVLLLAAQRPDATRLAGQEEWQARGRRVRRGEPGIQILTGPGESAGDLVHARQRRQLVAGAGWRAGREQRGEAVRPVYVWDVAQTTGPPVPGAVMPLARIGVPLPGLGDALAWLARREGFAVERTHEGSGDSETRWGSRRIVVSRALDEQAAVHMLLHELGHVLAHSSTSGPADPATSGCRGIRKIEADSIGYIVAARLGMDTSSYAWPQVASWAGSDPRARPEAAIQAAGSRITRAAAAIVAHLDVALYGTPSPGAAAVQNQEPELDHRAGAGPAGARTQPEANSVALPPAVVGQVLMEAERFYHEQLVGSWVPGYLADRGVGLVAGEPWRAGYAPGGWTALTSHLRRCGYADAVIEAAGLARRSARGTLIDHFRDRAMFAVRDEHGNIAGFIGRVHSGAGPRVPKYLNSPQTSRYRKGDLLFGLYEAQRLFASGATPVLVEGPFDAIAVSVAGGGRYAGLAPCGTALTSRQAAALASVADLGQAGVLVALDGDRAGRDGAARAYEVLAAHSDKLSAAVLPTGRDPAGILQADGPAALAGALQQTVPLAQVVIDAHLDRWGGRLGHAEGQLAAMRSAAASIALTLPADVANAIRCITGGQVIATLDEDLRPVISSALPQIARLLPAAAIFQAIRAADRTACDCSDVVAAVANVVSSETPSPKGRGSPGLRADARQRTVAGRASPARLAQSGFPGNASPITDGSLTGLTRPAVRAGARKGGSQMRRSASR